MKAIKRIAPAPSRTEPIAPLPNMLAREMRIALGGAACGFLPLCAYLVRPAAGS